MSAYQFDGTIHGALLPRDDVQRAARLLAWAAKCHVWRESGALPLPTHLAHSTEEIEDAIAVIERAYGKPAPSTDEGICCHSR